MRGKKGALSSFKEVPLDLLSDVRVPTREGGGKANQPGQIFSHLEPEDLLSLCLTTKTFCSLLLSPGALPLWVAARARVELLATSRLYPIILPGVGWSSRTRS